MNKTEAFEEKLLSVLSTKKFPRTEEGFESMKDSFYVAALEVFGAPISVSSEDFSTILVNTSEGEYCVRI